MNILKNEAQKIGIELNKEQLKKFEIYLNFLIEYNNHTNLTAITNPEDIMIKHFLDSIILNKFLNIHSHDKIIDIGTGAGFPGVPLKILKKDLELTLVDSLNKRIVFLKELIRKIELKAEIFHGRAEELSHKIDFREKFDFAVSRAVAPLNILSEYCLPYVKIGGCFIAMKGPDCEEEINLSKNSLKILGGKIQKTESFSLPKNKGSRSVVVIKKIAQNSLIYPRSNSQIAKNPL